MRLAADAHPLAHGNTGRMRTWLIGGIAACLLGGAMMLVAMLSSADDIDSLVGAVGFGGAWLLALGAALLGVLVLGSVVRETVRSLRTRR